MPASHHDDHEATPTPESGVPGVKRPDVGSNGKGEGEGPAEENGGEGVKIADQESSERGVNESAQSEEAIPEVTVVVETPPASSAELSQTSVEGGGGDVAEASGEGVNVEVSGEKGERLGRKSVPLCRSKVPKRPLTSPKTHSLPRASGKRGPTVLRLPWKQNLVPPLFPRQSRPRPLPRPTTENPTRRRYSQWEIFKTCEEHCFENWYSCEVNLFFSHTSTSPSRGEE